MGGHLGSTALDLKGLHKRLPPSLQGASFGGMPFLVSLLTQERPGFVPRPESPGLWSEAPAAKKGFLNTGSAPSFTAPSNLSLTCVPA